MAISCVPVLMYLEVHCASVLENHHFRAHMPLLNEALGSRRPCIIEGNKSFSSEI